MSEKFWTIMKYIKAPNIQNAHHLLDGYVKLLDAYRRYVPELEKYMPK
jgi:hypothetical protein